MNHIKKECVAMLLAGGQGSRLYALTQDMAKPAVPYGGKYRIIDFPLSNCVNSGIDTNLVPSYRECVQIWGMTTSVSLWTVSAIGIAVGAGLYICSVVTVILIMLIKWSSWVYQ